MFQSPDLSIARAGTRGGWQEQAREVRRQVDLRGGCGRGDTTQRRSVRRSERCTQVLASVRSGQRLALVLLREFGAAPRSRANASVAAPSAGSSFWDDVQLTYAVC